MLIKEEGPNKFGNKVFTFSGNYTFEVPKHYKAVELIGRGSFGIVCSAINEDTGEYIAIKKMKNIFEFPDDCKRLLSEIKIMNFLNHPNILKLKEIPMPNDMEHFTDIYLVTTLVNQDMRSLLRSPNVRLAAVHCQYLTLQLLFALQYIHSANILHRDIKPSNMLVSDDCTLFVSDFGLARNLSDDMTDYITTRWYRAPELLLGHRNYDFGVDLWSVGCVAVEMVTGYELFNGKNYLHQLNLIVDLLGPPKLLPGALNKVSNSQFLKDLLEKKPRSLEEVVPNLRRRFHEDSFYDSFDGEMEKRKSPMYSNIYYEQFKDFLFGLLKYETKDRLTASQAIMHPWLSDLRDELSDWKSLQTTSPLEMNYSSCHQLSAEKLRELFIEEIVKMRKTKTIKC